MPKCLHLSVKYYTFKVYHCWTVFIVYKTIYYGSIYHCHHITQYLQSTTFIKTMFLKVRLYHYEFLSPENLTTTSDEWQNIKSWINSHVICIATTIRWSFRNNHFESVHLTNTALKHFINDERNTGLFHCSNYGNIQSTPSLEPSRNSLQLFIFNTYNTILRKNLFPYFHGRNHSSTLYNPFLSLIISNPDVELHTLHPILMSPRLCMNTWKYALPPTLSYLGLHF